MDPEPVTPLESRTPTVGVRAPLSAGVVAHGIDTGPLLAVVVVPNVRPPSVSVYVFDPAAAFSIQKAGQPLQGTRLKHATGNVFVATLTVHHSPGGDGDSVKAPIVRA